MRQAYLTVPGNNAKVSAKAFDMGSSDPLGQDRYTTLKIHAWEDYVEFLLDEEAIDMVIEVLRAAKGDRSGALHIRSHSTLRISERRQNEQKEHEREVLEGIGKDW